MPNDNDKVNHESKENIVEQKNQFRNFVEGVSGGFSGNDGVTEDKGHIPDDQNRMIDKHNLRK